MPDETTDAWTLLRSAEALEQAGRVVEAAAALLALAGDGQVDAGVRVRAAAALNVPGHAEESAPISAMLTPAEVTHD